MIAESDWQEVIRPAVEQTNLSIRSIARYYNLPESTVRARARREGWRRPPRRGPSWEMIRVEYEAEIGEVRHIAERHNVTTDAIHKRAQRHGWRRGRLAEAYRQAMQQQLVQRALEKADGKRAEESPLVSAMSEALGALDRLVGDMTAFESKAEEGE